MRFTINNNLSFIQSIQFLTDSLDTLVKNVNKNVFTHFSEKFDNSLLDLVTRKDFCHYEYISDFKNLKKNTKERKCFIAR